jgi:tetratricopeptide (TPR) repeat protein
MKCQGIGISSRLSPAEYAIWGLMTAVRIALIVVAVVQGLVAAACMRAPVPMAVVPPAPRAAAEPLAVADRLVRQGCLDCLLDAYRLYDTVRGSGSAGAAATTAAIRTAALIALRERELGLVDSGYLTRARELAASLDPASPTLVQLLDLADALPYGSPAARPPALQERRMLLKTSQDWLTAPEPPSGLAVHQELFGYVWLALVCDVASAGAVRPDNARAGLGAMRDFPLLMFKFATACERRNPTTLSELLAQEPRFIEVHYFQGLTALSGQSRADVPGRPDLDEADTRLRVAYAWRPEWPALTVMLGNIAMISEDFAGALGLYRQTIALVPEQPDALLGTVRALTSLDRHAEAIAAADLLVMAGRFPGDARYWRALNEVHLSQFEEAWTDIELATTLLVNADVPKLAGIIAINRRQFDVARRRLDEAAARRPTDCEIGFYLQTTLSEQRAWSDAASTAGRAGACFDQEEALLRKDIDDLRASEPSEERRNRLIASRMLRIATNEGMRAACWFNAAVAHFNSGASDQARVYAEKVLADERFGARARDIVSRLGPSR